VKHVCAITRMPACASTTDIPEEVQTKVAMETAMLAFVVAILTSILPFLEKS